MGLKDFRKKFDPTYKDEGSPSIGLDEFRKKYDPTYTGDVSSLRNATAVTEDDINGINDYLRRAGDYSGTLSSDYNERLGKYAADFGAYYTDAANKISDILLETSKWRNLVNKNPGGYENADEILGALDEYEKWYEGATGWLGDEFGYRSQYKTEDDYNIAREKQTYDLASSIAAQAEAERAGTAVSPERAAEQKKIDDADAFERMEQIYAELEENPEKYDVRQQTEMRNEADAIRARLSAETRQEETAAKLDEYRTLMDNADFAEKSAYDESLAKGGPEYTLAGAAMLGVNQAASGYRDALYAAINGDRNAKEYLQSAGGGLTGTARALNEATYEDMIAGDKSNGGVMTADEIALFNYLYNTQGSDAAKEYYETLRPELNARYAEQEAGKWREYAQKDPVGASVYSTLQKAAVGSMTYPMQIADLLEDGRIDENAPYNRLSTVTSTIRDEVSNEISKSGSVWGKIGSWTYQLGMSMADSALNMLPTLLTGDAAGAEKGIENIMLAVMGSQAAADSVIEMKKRGYDDSKAFTLGTIAGLAEFATERIGMESLVGIVNKGLPISAFKNALLQQMGAEGLEEGLADLLNWFAEDIYVLYSGDPSEFAEDVEAAKSKGASNASALTSAIMKRAGEIGLDVLGGMISGLLFGAGGVAFNYGSDLAGRVSDIKATGTQQDVVTTGAESAKGTMANTLAKLNQARLDKGKNLSGLGLAVQQAANDFAIAREERTARKATESEARGEKTAETANETQRVQNAPMSAEKAFITEYAKVLGEQGGKTLSDFYIEGQDRDTYIAGMTAAYNAGVNGNESFAAYMKGNTNVTKNQLSAAYLAGQMDAAKGTAKAEAPAAAERSAKQNGVTEAVQTRTVKDNAIAQAVRRAASSNTSVVAESTLKQGISAGTNNPTVRVLTNGVVNKFPALKAARKNIQKQSGAQVVLYTGNLEIKNGETVEHPSVYMTPNGKRIFIKADADTSVEQLYENYVGGRQNGEVRGKTGRENINRAESDRMVGTRAGEQTRGVAERAEGKGEVRKVDARTLTKDATEGQSVEIITKPTETADIRALAKSQKVGTKATLFNDEIEVIGGAMVRGFYIVGRGEVGAQANNKLHDSEDIIDHENMHHLIETGKVSIEDVIDLAVEKLGSRTEIDAAIAEYDKSGFGQEELVCDGADHINQVRDLITTGAYTTAEWGKVADMFDRVIGAIHEAANELTDNAFALTDEEMAKYSGEATEATREAAGETKHSRRLKAEDIRDSGAKLTESQFYSLYSAHKLNMRGREDLDAQIENIKAEGFKGDGGFGYNLMPTRQDVKYPTVNKYNLLLEYEKEGVFPEGYAEEYKKSLGDEYGKAIPGNVSVAKYGPRKGDTILLVPKSGAEITKNSDRVKPGYKPMFDYEIVRAEYDFQPYYEMYSKAYDAYQAKTNAATEKVEVGFDAESESAYPTQTRFSMASFGRSDYVTERNKAAKELAAALDVTEKTAKKYIDDVNSIAKMIANDRVRLDYDSSPGRSSFVSNTEYGGSIDFSTICKKRRLLTGTLAAIQSAMPDGVLTMPEVLEIRKAMKDRGYEVSCGLCYVEGSRAKMGEFAAEFIKLYKKYNPNAEWTPNMKDVNTPDGAEEMRLNHPDVYKEYEYFWNHHGTLRPGDPNLFASQQKPKLYQSATEYDGEILGKFKGEKSVDEKNKNGGLRIQSFSDFEIIHLIDMMQVVLDMSRVGLAGQAYTKVPDFAWALGDTGMKINLSMIAKGVDENGRIIFDEVEGMKFEDAKKLRDRYSKNVGTILVVFNDEQLKAAMNDDFVDFIIPFHRSQWAKKNYKTLGLPSVVHDYTNYQNEKNLDGTKTKGNLMPNRYWDFSKSGKENAEHYLDLCAEEGRRPKFYELLVNNGDGSYSLQPDGSTDGYWKLLIDFKMYDNKGKGSPQMPVKPKFNMTEATRMLNDYTGGHRQFPVAQDIVDEFVASLKDTHTESKHSRAFTARDAEYMAAVERGNTEAAQRMVDEAAEHQFSDSKIRTTDGKLRKVFHGTNEKNFTVFDPRKIGRSNDLGWYGRGFYFAYTEGEASYYGERIIPAYLNIVNPFNYESELATFDNQETTVSGDLAAFVINLTEKFSELASDLNIYVSVWAGDREVKKGIPFKEYAAKILDLYNDEKLKVYKTTDRFGRTAYSYKYDGDLNIMALRTTYMTKESAEKHRLVAATAYVNSHDFYDVDVRTPEKYMQRISRAFSEELKARGYDGIIQSEAGDEAIAFSPSQIKSADPVTYDDDGNVIPLSERFNDEKPDIRWSRMFPAGEQPRARDVDVPMKVNGRNVSETTRTVEEAEVTPEEMIPTIDELVQKGVFSYDRVSNEDRIKEAAAWVKKEGYERAYTQWVSNVGTGRVTAQNTARGWALYNAAANAGDTETAVEILRLMVRHQRSAAQAVQATRILKRMSPSAQLYFAIRSIESINEELQEKYGDRVGTVTIDPGLAADYNNAQTQEERDEILKAIYRDVGKQIPPNWKDRFNAWRYLAMLGNLRTHVRNVAGNLFFAPVVGVKDIIATGIETGLANAGVKSLQNGRTKAFVGVRDADIAKAAWEDFTKHRDEALGEKYNDNLDVNKYVQEGRQIFGRTGAKAWDSTAGKALEKARRGNSLVLNVEDQWFSQPHYALAMTQYCKANGITAAEIAEDTERVQAARKYAIKEAQKATYRDVNGFSEAVRALGRYHGKNWAMKIGSALVEGVLPFKATPANILARGVEYSPVGLAYQLTKGLYDVKHGNKTAAEFIDGLAAGLTGTGIMLLGVLLAKLGLVRGRKKDKKKEQNFEGLTGHQAYSLELPDGTSITLDWLAPAALPFFVGVNLQEAIAQYATALDTDDPLKILGALKMSDYVHALSGITEPMLEMSCLQGINGLIKSVSYDQNNALAAAAEGAATSLFTQIFPTVLGQFERLGQKERISTFVDKNQWLSPSAQRTIGNLSAKIPVWEYNQIPYIDEWGRTEKTGNVAQRAANNFINPAYTDKVRESDMEKELWRLYEDTGDSGVLPGSADKSDDRSLTIDKQTIDLNANQYVTYATTKGQTAYKALTAMTKSSTYSSLTDKEKVKAVEKVYSYAREIAENRVFPNSAPVSPWVNVAKEVGIETYALAYAAVSDVIGLFDSKKKTIKDSISLAKMQRLWKIREVYALSDEARIDLFTQLGVGSSVAALNKAAVDEKLKAMKNK